MVNTPFPFHYTTKKNQGESKKPYCVKKCKPEEGRHECDGTHGQGEQNGEAQCMKG